jgi:3-isopropylmalate/(R)-2-methylmalate dehydratase small subunit
MRLMDRLLQDPGTRLSVDLASQRIWDEDEELVLTFDVDPFRKECLLEGLDEIGLTMQHETEIAAFEART